LRIIRNYSDGMDSGNYLRGERTLRNLNNTLLFQFLTESALKR
jgi:hypothetical protein